MYSDLCKIKSVFGLEQHCLSFVLLLFRSHLESSIETHKETQRELSGLLGKKNSKHVPTPTWEEQSSENPLDPSAVDEETPTKTRAQEMKRKMTLCAIRPSILGKKWV